MASVCLRTPRGRSAEVQAQTVTRRSLGAGNWAVSAGLKAGGQEKERRESRDEGQVKAPKHERRIPGWPASDRVLGRMEFLRGWSGSCTRGVAMIVLLRIEDKPDSRRGTARARAKAWARLHRAATMHFGRAIGLGQLLCYFVAEADEVDNLPESKTALVPIGLLTDTAVSKKISELGVDHLSTKSLMQEGTVSSVNIVTALQCGRKARPDRYQNASFRLGSTLSSN